MDEFGEACLQYLLIAHVPAFERAGFEVLDQDIGVGQQLQHDFSPLFTREVDHDPLLVAIHPFEVRRGLSDKRRSPASRFIARGRFELDDRGAMISDGLRAIRATEHATQIDDFQPLECSGFHAHDACSLCSGSSRSASSSDSGTSAPINARISYMASSAPMASGSRGRSLYRAIRWASPSLLKSGACFEASLAMKIAVHA